MRPSLALLFALVLVGSACSSSDDSPTATVQPEVPSAVPRSDSAQTLELVRARGRLACGTQLGLPGFAFQDADLEMTGLDVDTCRAVAAAVTGSAANVEWVALDASNWLTALEDGQVDLVARVTTWTLGRDVAMQLDFGPTTFYDGQGILVRADDHESSDGLESLEGQTICVVANTTSEANIRTAIESAGLAIEVRSVPTGADQVIDAFVAGECQAATGDRSGLIAFKPDYAEDPDDVLILDLVLSKEPLGPVYREGDPSWADVVNWTVYTLIIAEEKGITSTNIDDVVAATTDPEVQTLFAGDGVSLPESMDLDADAFRRVIASVGNYAQIYERNFGPLGIARGLNALWTDGGLMYAPPAR